MTGGTVTLIIKLIDVLLMGVPLGVQAYDQLKALKTELKPFEGRDPTVEEWGALNGKIDAALARIAARAFGGEPE